MQDFDDKEVEDTELQDKTERKKKKFVIIAAMLSLLLVCAIVYNAIVMPVNFKRIFKVFNSGSQELDSTGQAAGNTNNQSVTRPSGIVGENNSTTYYEDENPGEIMTRIDDADIGETSGEGMTDAEPTAGNSEQMTQGGNNQTQAPTQKPTQAPTQAPTQKPTQAPTQKPTQAPAAPPIENGTPLQNHGKLSVNGVNLVDSKGNPYQLKGVSTHGLAWFPQYVNKEAFKTLRDDWGVNLIRLAMYTAESGGYCTGGNKANLEKIVDNGVTYATELGMYVIIDWHILNDHNPMTYINDAKEFWKKTSAKYASYNNVIYEICNEPNGCSWADVKKYADTIIPIIRANDKDAVIIVGTPTWSQDVDQVAGNPLKSENQKNVMYAVHFYAATHGDFLRNKVKTARAAGTPVFVSEFSICDASGNGGIDYTSANAWKKLINDCNLSYAGWSLCNKAETASLIKSGNAKWFGWTVNDLSDTGKFLREMCGGGNDNVNLEDLTVPATQAPQPPQQTQAPTQAPQPPQPTQPPKTEMTYQFDVTVKNISGTAQDDWTIIYNLPSGCSIFGSWCCEVSIEATKLTVKPAGYNAHTEAGGSVSGIGIQISSPQELTDFTVNGDGFEATFHIGNSW